MIRKDYCSHCRRRTEHIKDFLSYQAICKTCGRKKKMFRSEGLLR